VQSQKEEERAASGNRDDDRRVNVVERKSKSEARKRYNKSKREGLILRKEEMTTRLGEATVLEIRRRGIANSREEKLRTMHLK
jgi:hypothetical protein